jgi:response regulator RpfG family c-di-GMP phosphodiesterase
MTTLTGPAPAPPENGVALPRILCVDDEPHILEALRDNLRRDFEVTTASDPRRALALLREDPCGYAVVLSDMRMPVVSGAELLGSARSIAPDAVRIVLTGQAQLGSAIAAVNHGQVFRFLTKPASRDDLRLACRGALQQHRLLVSERELLEETLRGSVEAITEVLALANPAAFGRASRIRRHAAALAHALGIEDAWAVEVAAMFCQIGAVTLPEATVQKLYDGAELTAEEYDWVDRMPLVAQRILANIPRLDLVRALIARYRVRLEDEPDLPLGARILRIAFDFDSLTGSGMDPRLALATMRGRTGVYDTRLLAVFCSRITAAKATRRVREVELAALKPGMQLTSDVRTRTGSLLVPAGHTVTEELVEKLRNLGPGAVQQPLLVEGPA